METLVLLLLIAAAACFLLALASRPGRVDWIAAGLLAWALAAITEHLPGWD